MLSMKEKAFLGLVIIFAAVVAANFFIPVSTFDVSLVTSPPGGSFYLPAGEPFNITCQGSGDGGTKFSSVRWLNAKGNVISEGIPGVRKGESNSLTLIFIKPKVEESGVYKCVAVYDNKHTLESSVIVNFYGNKPTFPSGFENVTAEEYSYLEIPCTAFGDKPITYEWYTQYEDKVTEGTNSSIYVSNYENGSALVIPKVQRSHEGMYTCSAGNEHGLSSKIYQLLVLPSSCNDTCNGISSFRDAVAVNITSNSVEFSLSFTGRVKFIEVKYHESRSAAEYIMEWNNGDNYEVKGLIPGGYYSFKFRTVPSENDAWSRSYFIILLPAVPEVIFRNVEGGSVKLEWLRKIEDSLRGTIDLYELSYRTVRMIGGNDWEPSKCAIKIQIPSCSGSSYTISGLSQNVYYEIQLRAHTSSGYGESYKQKIFLSR